jgi:hypothetical protein
MACDDDASIGDSSINENTLIVVSKGKLSAMYCHGCSCCKRRRFHSNNGDDCIGVAVINVTG